MVLHAPAGEERRHVEVAVLVSWRLDFAVPRAAVAGGQRDGLRQVVFQHLVAPLAGDGDVVGRRPATFLTDRNSVRETRRERIGCSEGALHG